MGFLIIHYECWVYKIGKTPILLISLNRHVSESNYGCNTSILGKKKRDWIIYEIATVWHCISIMLQSCNSVSKSKCMDLEIWKIMLGFIRLTNKLKVWWLMTVFKVVLYVIYWIYWNKIFFIFPFKISIFYQRNSMNLSM